MQHSLYSLTQPQRNSSCERRSSTVSNDSELVDLQPLQDCFDHLGPLQGSSSFDWDGICPPITPSIDTNQSQIQGLGEIIKKGNHVSHASQTREEQDWISRRGPNFRQ